MAYNHQDRAEHKHRGTFTLEVEESSKERSNNHSPNGEVTKDTGSRLCREPKVCL